MTSVQGAFGFGCCTRGDRTISLRVCAQQSNSKPRICSGHSRRCLRSKLWRKSLRRTRISTSRAVTPPERVTSAGAATVEFTCFEGKSEREKRERIEDIRFYDRIPVQILSFLVHLCWFPSLFACWISISFFAVSFPPKTQNLTLFFHPKKIKMQAECNACFNVRTLTHENKVIRFEPTFKFSHFFAVFLRILCHLFGDIVQALHGQCFKTNCGHIFCEKCAFELFAESDGCVVW